MSTNGFVILISAGLTNINEFMEHFQWPCSNNNPKRAFLMNWCFEISNRNVKLSMLMGYF